MKNNLFLFLLAAVVLGAFMFAQPADLYASRGGSKKPSPNPLRAPYTCGQDLCQGYRCVIGTEIRPACYNASEILKVKCTGGEFVYIPTFSACYSTQYYYNWGI